MARRLGPLALFLLVAAQGDDIPAGMKLIADVTAPLADREAAVKRLSRTKEGAQALVALADQEKFPDELKATARFALAASPDPDARALGEKKLPRPKGKDGTPLPPVGELVSRKGDAANGAKIFRRAEGPNCLGCHQLRDEGKMVGPPLTTVGLKLSKELMYESILTPSAAILMSYENWAVRTTDGDVKTGIKVEDTDDHITLKDTQGEYLDIPVAKIAEKKMLKLSMMPEELTKSMTVQELVDLIEYLTQLKE
jgi:putative heme-binding domain-containing protein